MPKTRAHIASDLSNRILEIVDLDAPRSDVHGCAEALAASLADAVAALASLRAAAAPHYADGDDALADALNDSETALLTFGIDHGDR